MFKTKDTLFYIVEIYGNIAISRKKQTNYDTANKFYLSYLYYKFKLQLYLLFARKYIYLLL